MLQSFAITFTVGRRLPRTWVRFHETQADAERQARETLQREFGEKAKLVSVVPCPDPR